jgi:hypothetical protein
MASEFEESSKFEGSPKLSTNSAWKLVPVEPTDAMLDAMQESALVSLDAAIEAELNDGPAVESLHRVVYRAMLAAAPDAPSAEPCPHIRSGGTGQWATNWCALAEQPADHRAVMRQAIEALRDAHAYSVMHEEFRDGVLDVIEALRAALGDADAA